MPNPNIIGTSQTPYCSFFSFPISCRMLAVNTCSVVVWYARKGKHSSTAPYSVAHSSTAPHGRAPHRTARPRKARGTVELQAGLSIKPQVAAESNVHAVLER